MAETEEVDFDEQVDLGDGGATMETELDLPKNARRTNVTASWNSPAWYRCR